ncbi:MAG: N-acetylmuramoyl-L-alanine amidase [Candidatus Aureabacteria bacterium]|nr:N-acetylmuramoyl-L-alanine amidase [Candidatus Auribacterota bacterium]
MKKVFFLFIVFFAFSVVSGFSLNGPAGRVETSIYKSYGVPYIDINSIVKSFGLVLYWNPVLKEVKLEAPGFALLMSLNNRYASANGRTFDMSGPMIFHNGILYVPLDVKEQVLDLYMKTGDSAAGNKRARLQNFKVVIDPGHGGENIGARNKNGADEKTIVLDIAKKVMAILEKNGLQVVMTRDKDVFLKLSKRCDIAQSEKADLFISIHANSAPAKSVTGIETFVLGIPTSEVIKSIEEIEDGELALGDSIYTNGQSEPIDSAKRKRLSKRLACFINEEVVKSAQVKNRGVKEARFYVLRNTDMPAVLVEVGFISNADESVLLLHEDYRNKIAQGIASGVLNYFQE